MWGPSSEQPQLGIAACIEGLRQFLAWDTFARRRVDMIGRKDHGDEVIAHEFDYSIPNQVTNQPVGPTFHYIEYDDQITSPCCLANLSVTAITEGFLF